MKKNRWFAVIPAMVMVLAIPGFSEGSDSKKMQGNKLANLALAESSKGSYSDCVVGDFVLKDGTILSKDETPESDTVAAVIVRAATDDKPALGVGIVQRKDLAWYKAKDHYTNITALQGDTTSGYIDGSDGWDRIAEACDDWTEFKRYPAWNYCLSYKAGRFNVGWYLPTMAELYTIYQNKDVVNESLSKAGGSQFGNELYWSCCQSPSHDAAARLLDFSNGSMEDYFKVCDFIYVCSVRAFY